MKTISEIIKKYHSCLPTDVGCSLEQEVREKMECEIYEAIALQSIENFKQAWRGLLMFELIEDKKDVVIDSTVKDWYRLEIRGFIKRGVSYHELALYFRREGTLLDCWKNIAMDI